MTVDWAMMRLRADEQADLLTRAQCLAAGFTDEAIRWRLASNRWVTRYPGLYLTKPGRDDAAASIWAALLSLDGRADPWAPPRAAVAGAAAAYLWGLGPAPTTAEIVVPAARHAASRSGVRVRRLKLFDSSIVATLSPPRTSLERTVLDCGAGGTPDNALAWAAKAVQQRRTSTERLAAELKRMGRHPHGGLLRECLATIKAGAESPAEVRYIRDVEQAHGLPVAARQPTKIAGRHDNLYVEHGGCPPDQRAT